MIREGSLKTTAIDDDLDPFNVDPNPDKVADGDPFADDHEVPQQLAVRHAKFGRGAFSPLKHLLRGQDKLKAASVAPAELDDPFGDDLTPAYNDDPFGDTPQELQAAAAAASSEQVPPTERTVSDDESQANRALSSVIGEIKGQYAPDGRPSRALNVDSILSRYAGDDGVVKDMPIAMRALMNNQAWLGLSQEEVQKIEDSLAAYEKAMYK